MNRYLLPLIINSTRKLHLFNHPKPEWLIANNSGLFFALAAIREHGIDMHPNLHTVIPPFWLDSILPEYHSLDWGQPAYCLPWFVREEFFHLNPTHPKDRKITWGQYKELRSYIIEELKACGVRIYTGEPNIEKTSNGYNITTAQGKFNISEQAHFYNAYRELKTDHELGNDFPKTLHIKFYQTPRNKAPRIAIVLGGGRSAIWLAQHFPDTLFACVSPQKELPLFKNEKQPENLMFFPKNGLATSDSNGFKIVPNTDNKENVMMVRIKSDGQLEPIFDAPFYCAIGMRHRSEITAKVDKHQLTYFPVAKEDKWGENWVAPIEVPVGGLMEATMRWAVATHNLSWAYETFCYHSNHFISIIIPKLEQKGITLPYTFFDFLRSDIISKNLITSLEETIEIYQKSLSKAYGDTPPKGLLEELAHALNEIEEERLDYYRSIPSQLENGI